jgi:hypothetical protein|nr:MAG TPA: protein of unknown function (DUF5572) [Inoviridae sp.]
MSSMDDLSITISLQELMTLIDSAKHVPGIERELASLSRRLDSLYAIYLQVLERLREFKDELL